MGPVRDVVAGYRAALERLGSLVLIHLAVRLLVAALIVPAAAALLALALAASGQDAVTDQDIARFLLTPAGAAAGLALVSLLLVAAVLDIAVMSDALRRGERRPLAALRAGLWTVARRLPRLLSFALRLVLRILALAAPFLALGGLVVWLALGRYDINYYLAQRPPAFLAAAGIGALLAAGLAGLLLARLSAWAIALHLVLRSETAPRDSFAESARLLRGRGGGVLARLAAWGALRALLAALVATLGALLVGAAQDLAGANLRSAALATLALLLLVGLANAGAAALSNGALAALLDRLFRDAAGRAGASAAPAVSAAPTAPVVSDPAVGRVAVPAVLVPAVLAAAAVAVAGGLALGGQLLARVSAERQVEIIAHRGAAGSRPENTMAAVEKALRDGADWVEIDVQETADGAVVVAHDSDFMKLAGVDLKVWDATLDDLAEIDIGSWYDPAYADQRTPTLGQVLEAARGRGKVLIELKYYGHDVALEARVAEIVDAAGMAGEIAVMSLKIPGVRKMQALRPDWAHGILAATALGDLSALEADFLAVNTGQVSLGLIERVHARGRKLYVWTVDDPLAMSRMISMGVDGLITNEPALARQVMAARNRLTAPERLLLWASDRLRLDSFGLVADASDA